MTTLNTTMSGVMEEGIVMEILNDATQVLRRMRKIRSLMVCPMRTCVGASLTSMSSESDYNDRKGIEYVFCLQTVFPPWHPNEKRCANAKAPALRGTFYLHEAKHLSAVLDACIESISHTPKSLIFKIVAGKLRKSCFTLTWTIPCTDFRDMSLTSIKDWEGVLKKLNEKGSAAAKVKLDMIELELPQLASTTSEDEPQAKKHRTTTVAEEAINEAIQQVRAENHCSAPDSECPSPYCFIGNTLGKHVVLNPPQQHLWRSALAAKADGATASNPPEDAQFRPIADGSDNKSADDVSLLAARH
ncbi:unnamed protein product [Mycena citricolor]|uniref:Uncharacterized protein n=1 Tax=Mycena citricolor TaxID=2018698 RepID=A0AAD2JVA6_9AGAR|nr:unnamed protein product [Mycena citricolor]